ncbi:hypothetical protein ColTof3_14864 [Colletotrichum tofieldiae]|nr:hypothetical protein ColTof3_14864 [Colletotrichum tofieldiae]
MPLSETLAQLNANVQRGPENVLRGLWTQLQRDFHNDSSHAGDDFRAWALQNVVGCILNLVNDATFATDVARIPFNVTRRWKTALARHGTSLGTLAFLFGVKVVASRPCATAVSNLARRLPAKRLTHLHATYQDQMLAAHTRQLSDVERFRGVIRHIDPYGWPKKNTKKKDSRTATSDDTDAADTDVEVGSAPSSRSASPVLSPLLDMDKSDLSARGDVAGVGHAGVGHTKIGPPDEHDANGHVDAVSRAGLCKRIDNNDMGSWQGGNDGNSYGSYSQAVGLGLRSPVALPTIPEESIEIDGTEVSIDVERTEVSNLSGTTEQRTDVSESNVPVDLEATVLSLSPGPSKDTPLIDTTPLSLPFTVDSRPRGGHKRSLDNLEMVSPFGDRELQTKRTKLPPIGPPVVFDLTREASHPPPSSGILTRRVDLQDAVRSLSTLDQGRWLNDTVMQTIGQRLECDSIGIINSLAIAAQRMTDRGRLLLQSAISKSQVFLFLNQNGNHWVLFVWERDRNVVTEYNSMAETSFDAATAPSQVILGFLRSVTKDPQLRLVFRRQKCPQQPNGFDCGVYALFFAEKVANNEAMPATVDGGLERACMKDALLTSRNCVLRPDELMPLGRNVPCTTTERAARIKLLRVRQANFHSLLRSYQGQTTSTGAPCTRQIRSLAESEWHDCQLSTLAGVILDSVAMHRRALEGAISFHEVAGGLRKAKELDAAVREQVKGFIAAMDACSRARASGGADAAGLSISEDPKLGNCLAMYTNAVLAEAAWADSDEKKAREQCRLQKATRNKYLESCVWILALRFMVAKFRRQRQKVLEARQSIRLP